MHSELLAWHKLTLCSRFKTQPAYEDQPGESNQNALGILRKSGAGRFAEMVIGRAGGTLASKNTVLLKIMGADFPTFSSTHSGYSKACSNTFKDTTNTYKHTNDTIK